MIVVEVLTGVVEHGLVLAIARLDDVLEALALEARTWKQLVQRVDIGLVAVFSSVILERLSRHVGLKCVILVWKLHEFEGHGISPAVSFGKSQPEAKGSKKLRQASSLNRRCTRKSAETGSPRAFGKQEG